MRALQQQHRNGIVPIDDDVVDGCRQIEEGIEDHPEGPFCRFRTDVHTRGGTFDHRALRVISGKGGSIEVFIRLE
jgi:hypothetical protein